MAIPGRSRHPPAGARLRRWIAALIIPALVLGLSGCSDGRSEADADRDPPAPLLYELAAADGTVEGWMVGTIHALPDGIDWRTAAVQRAIDEADVLVVEVATLGDTAALGTTFAQLATSPSLPALADRVPAAQRAPLAALMHRGGLSDEDFASTETWAVALALARVDAAGDPANGVDRALINDFADRRVSELEGAAGQLAIFDRLPEARQRTMLAAVIAESAAADKDPERLQRAWAAGDAEAIETASREGILADPDLREALLTARNRRWAAALLPVLRTEPRPLIAVGAAHLVGPDGLAALLAAQGYRVRRIEQR
ncbi:TraB/GumN family protein [Erythrobacter neustonensis]|uniref:Polysaccharide biosynthesis protein GumN n=1 Tax=Erythrobacter neustonensis TaxID=1112 RepID=A0A192D605_9SPHN|nr:TraB/GumN family protein [Erythrobacter neustonensis]ANK13530.1 hypothetical protein A9D12_11960 [Erythrobacter neustonensis]